MNYSAYAALIIAILALFFTIFRFWWMNWRRGRLIIRKPRSYAAVGSEKNVLIIEVPLVFFNNGAIPILVQNLRLSILEESPNPKPLTFVATVEKLGTSEGRAFASQFPVRARESLLLICEFQRRPGNFLFEAKRYQIELQALIDEEDTWKTLTFFELNINSDALKTINEIFITHDNLSEYSD
jgi:hypothetical protein